MSGKMRLLLLVTLFVGTLARPEIMDRKAFLSGLRVSAWKPTDRVNPEELGLYFQGDMILDDKQMEKAKNGIIDEAYRWPNGIVPYTIDEEDFTSTELDTIHASMDSYNTLTDGCIQFVPRTNEDDYVNIRGSDSGCSANVGRIGGRQKINYHPPGCLTRFGTVQHEMYHALGFHHEQSRSERDDFVTINWDNIESGHEHNFYKYDESEVTAFGVPYDYGSAMHYSRTAFGIDDAETITPTDPDAEIGQRVGLSELDIEKLKKMYNCPT